MKGPVCFHAAMSDAFESERLSFDLCSFCLTDICSELTLIERISGTCLVNVFSWNFMVHIFNFAAFTVVMFIKFIKQCSRHMFTVHITIFYFLNFHVFF